MTHHGLPVNCHGPRLTHHGFPGREGGIASRRCAP